MAPSGEICTWSTVMELSTVTRLDLGQKKAQECPDIFGFGEGRGGGKGLAGNGWMGLFVSTLCAAQI